MFVAGRADSHNGSKSGLRELRRELADGAFVEPAEDEWSIDRLHQRSETLEICRRHIASDRGLTHCLWKARSAHRLWLRAIHGVNLEHLLDRRYACDRLLRELADAIRDGA